MTHPTATVSAALLQAEVARRRTFAIISHPDAGKTTLTEKFLLYGGAVEEAGSVRARKNARRSTSDWMAMERDRGISISSTALQFDYLGCRFNLLDTPGHQDFSEDTYRTLMAVDAAIMVLDAARGIEPQTRKLFDVCRQRRIPILTFINKLDRPGQDPLDLLDEIERTLGIQAVPMNWPIGDGPNFQGVFDLKMVLSHGSFDGWLAADALAKWQTPVNLGPRMYQFDRRGRMQGMCQAYWDAGCHNMSINTDAPVIPPEELQLQAAMAIRLGLPYAAALRALTIVPAQQIGIADRTGSLTVGKDADFQITAGDPLDPRHGPLLVYIEGTRVYRSGEVR